MLRRLRSLFRRPEPALPDEAADRLREQWRAHFAGACRGPVFVLDRPVILRRVVPRYRLADLLRMPSLWGLVLAVNPPHLAVAIDCEPAGEVVSQVIA
jgi:hypothetical protein